MMSQQEVEIHIVWLNEQKRIASFHPVNGYERHLLCGHEPFEDFLFFLVKNGYRLQ